MQSTLMNVANFLDYIGTKVSDKSEIFDLNQSDLESTIEKQTIFTKYEIYMADKMNIAEASNFVSQLHTHIIVRYKKDDAWPNPVWSILI